MQFWNPLPAGSLLKLLRELPLPNGAQVLDYGCGEGELSLQLALWHRATITGVDPNPEAIARCRSKLPGTFLAEPFQPERFQPASFDLIANLGASPGMPQLLREVAPLLRPAAHLLIGDIYWRRPPSDTYLAFLGATGASTPTLDDHHAALRASGFTLEQTLLASDADWDRYEHDYDANMVAFLNTHRDDPAWSEFETRRRAWRTMYLQHGRGCMGFALYHARSAG
jgi:SAM-dependent methyltransferase